MRSPVRSLLPSPLHSLLFACVALLTLLLPSTATAQSTGIVTGHVIDEEGTPLQGVTVFAVGTQFGALSRGDGSYRFTLPPGATPSALASSATPRPPTP